MNDAPLTIDTSLSEMDHTHTHTHTHTHSGDTVETESAVKSKLKAAGTKNRSKLRHLMRTETSI